MRLIEHLVKTVRNAAVFNPEVQVAPACVLWPDRDRQWEAVIPRLQSDLPELFILGNYAPEKRTGPAIWLRCVIAGMSDGEPLPSKLTPIFYLPGVSRQDLRAVENCPDHLKPLAELQYRGVIWSQTNARDWTILAFLKSDQGGLGLDVAQDGDAKNAMQLALYRLVDEEVERFRGKRLDKDYFNKLLTGGDPVRDLLQWLDQGDAFRNSRSEYGWKAFVEVCKSQIAFNPQTDGTLAGAARLAAHECPWAAVWERFCEAPKRYPNIPGRIRQCTLPSFDLFSNQDTHGGWPQWNERQEKSLHDELKATRDLPAHEARSRLLEMEKKHGCRRTLVWAELGEAPLAQALEHLTLLAETTRNSLSAGTVDDLADGYRHYGWQADDAVIRALSLVDNPSDLDAITTAIRSVYLPWADESAHHLQKIVDSSSYPGSASASSNRMSHLESNCILFVDGLRFDAARRLADMLEKNGCTIIETLRWAALPSVTGTGKPAVAPLGNAGAVSEEPEPSEFQVLTSYQFDKALKESGWLVIRPKDPVPPPVTAMSSEFSAGASRVNRIWAEYGNLDHEGHERGWKLARHIHALLLEICDRIAALFAAGWKSVRVITDHGWLLMPGGLPKINIPACLSDSKWGRCALLKPGASIEGRLYPWYWNPNQHFALADGISCFKNGEEYAHGGLSLQECLTLELTVTRDQGTEPVVSVEFTDVAWKRLRCTVAVEGNTKGLSLDVRMQPGDLCSSVVVGIKPLKDNGTASVVVENEELEGHEATLVLIDANNLPVAQIATVIGGGSN